MTSQYSRADYNGYVCHWPIPLQIKTETARDAKAAGGLIGKHVEISQWSQHAREGLNGYAV